MIEVTRKDLEHPALRRALMKLGKVDVTAKTFYTIDKIAKFIAEKSNESRKLFMEFMPVFTEKDENGKDKLDEQGNPFIISDIAKRKEFEDKVQALEKEVVTLDWNKIPREELAGLKLTSEEWLFLNHFLTEVKEA